MTKEQAGKNKMEYKHSPVEWSRWLVFLITLVVLIITALLFIYNFHILQNPTIFSNIFPVSIAIATVVLALLSIAFSRTARRLTSTETPTSSPAPVLPILTSTSADPNIRITGPLFELYDSVFQDNQLLTDPKQFFGREAEYIKLVSRTKQKAPTSIIGPTRIGKTWLITYLRLKSKDEFGPNFRMGYFDASLPSGATIAGFTNNALEALEYTDIPIQTTKGPLGLLEAAVKDFAKRQPASITPVLCIDEFGALESKNGFSLEFFTHLRSLMSLGLVIITASRQPLIETVDEPSKTSPFFNSFLQISLKPFNRKEAEAFVKAKGDQAKLTATERERLLEYGQEENKEQWNVLRLQQFGRLLLQKKYLSRFDTSQTPPDRPGDSEYWHEFKEELEGELEEQC